MGPVMGKTICHKCFHFLLASQIFNLVDLIHMRSAVFQLMSIFLCYIDRRMCTLHFYLVQCIFRDIKWVQDVAIFAGDLLLLLGISKSAASFSYNMEKNTI